MSAAWTWKFVTSCAAIVGTVVLEHRRHSQRVSTGEMRGGRWSGPKDMMCVFVGATEGEGFSGALKGV